MAKIEISTAWVEFRRLSQPEPVTALSDISLSLKSGDRLGITGPNGSGKTTLLRLISGIYPPTRGDVKVVGSVSSLLGISSGMHAKMSGRQNIVHRSKLLGRSKLLTQQTVEDAIVFSGLGERIDDPLESYSSGMRMRLIFSLATAVPADIVIMDEWLSVGDSKFKKKARARLKEYVGNSQILILASHDRSLLASECNKFIQLSGGRGQVAERL